ncbi:MAG: tRNA (guanosine(46)-N7)-methyltransferase TrmB [Cytophagales bacterium]|nr:tRNA (guanosine(46)-N7)-methyltransferase TrmB [Cytophagales bacterium]
MSRRKLLRFEENKFRENIVEPGKPFFDAAKGRWHEAFFRNPNLITLELACGRGEYTTGLAAVYPDRNFIGVDIKGDRLWRGSTAALEAGLANAAFLRTPIDFLERHFAEGEVGEIWIVHPDPRPRKSDDKRRLTHPRYLEMYKKLLRPGGLVHLKTDSPLLFEYTMEVLQQTPVTDLQYTTDLYHSDLLPLHHGIRTHYERIFTGKGFTVNYLQFRFA